MNLPAKIMVVDDEPKIRNLLRLGLSMHGYEVVESPDGKTAVDLLQHQLNLIILDLTLPDVAGHELLRQIRICNDVVSIVVLSGRRDEVGKVAALDLGADDYLTKPFTMNELLARVRAALRHQSRVQNGRPVFRAGNLFVDLARGTVDVGDRSIQLTAKEYYVLRMLVLRAGMVVTQELLLRELWDQLANAEDLRASVQQLRRKIETDPVRPKFILTETGVGYCLRAPESIAEPRNSRIT
jgi:two-component system, OmpR family, KDP operon response regulator KdpE